MSSDRVLRLRPTDGPFALTLRLNNADQIYCLNDEAQDKGVYRGMPLSEARAFCLSLQTAPADPDRDARLLEALRRWATRYCPWVGLEGKDGLTLDITGAAHLWGDEQGMLTDMQARLQRAGLAVRIGLADTRGAAWALAHSGGGTAAAGETFAALDALPVAGLRLDEGTIISLQRLGLRTIGAVAGAPRAPLARRFGPALLRRLDQATGAEVEAITPLADQPHYAVRLTLPDPIGLTVDVMAGTGRLLDALCGKLRAHESGARALRLTLRRVDQQSQTVDLRLATAMRDPARILPLFAYEVEKVDAGFGIDQMRLQAIQVEPLPMQQISQASQTPDQLNNLITRIGTRIGLENILRFLPADSHIPERSFAMAPAALTRPSSDWHRSRPHPLQLFPPEPITARGAAPPVRFRWRSMGLTTARATGPERIAPEWWITDENWRSGLRDYWRVETHQGRRLWLFYTPQNPGWFVHGEFA